MKVTDIESTLHLFMCSWGFERVRERDLQMVVGHPDCVRILDTKGKQHIDRNMHRLFTSNRSTMTFRRYEVPRIFFNPLVRRCLADKLLEWWANRNIMKRFRPKYRTTVCAEFFVCEDEIPLPRSFTLCVGIMDGYPPSDGKEEEQFARF